MARRVIDVDGQRWEVSPSGRFTPYDRDEFTLVFEQGTGPGRLRRFARYSPRGARRRDASLQGLSDAELVQLFQHSQPAWTSPDGAYARS
jgi:hypothetical protein